MNTGLHTNFFKKLKFVTGTGKYKATASSIVPFEDKFIIGTNLIDAKHQAAIQTLVAGTTVDADGRTDISIEEIDDMSASIWNGDTPMKGEEFDVTIGLVESKTGEMILGITRAYVKPVSEGTGLDLTKFFGEDAEALEEAPVKSNNEPEYVK